MKVSKEILELVPYKPGKPISETQRQYGLTEVYKLASNENPLGVSPKVKEALVKAIEGLGRYPDPTFYSLLQTVSQEWGIAPQQLTIGNGSDELFDLLIRIYCEPGDSILTTQAAFAAYAISAQAARVKTLEAPLKNQFETDLAQIGQVLREKRESHRIRLVFLPNPNNPTGTYLKAAEVLNFLKEWGSHPELLIVFDEAYTEFVRAQDYQPALDYLKEYPSVVVTRTLSKAYGLAGFRVGILAAPSSVIDFVNRVRKPFNVNELAQVAAIAALCDKEFVRRTVEITWQGLDYFYKELQKLKVPYVESQGNFLLLDTQRDSGQVFEAMLRKGVILRPVGNYGFKTHLRMSVGLPKENEAAIKALIEVLGEIKPN